MKVLYGNQSEHNIRYLLQGTKSTSRLEVAVSASPPPFFEARKTCLKLNVNPVQ